MGKFIVVIASVAMSIFCWYNAASLCWLVRIKEIFPITIAETTCPIMIEKVT